MVAGGAIGNLIDRIVRADSGPLSGAVVDFIDWHAYGYHWPVFNIADAGITLGVGVLIAESLFGHRSKPTSQGEQEL